MERSDKFPSFFSGSTANSDSLLYIVTKDGKRNYLLGSIHIPLEVKLSIEAKTAFEEASCVVFEHLKSADTLELEGEKIAEYCLAWFAANEDQIDASESNDQAKQIVAVMKNILPAHPLEPLAIPLEVYHMALTTETYKKLENKKPFEQDLVEAAIALNKPYFGLAAFSDEIKALYGLELTYQEQLDVVTHLLPELSEERIINFLKNFKEAFLSRNLDTMYKLALAPYMTESLTSSSINKYLQQIVHNRDKQMASAMEKYLQDGKAFITIGSSHLPGVINELSSKGYEIKPVKEGPLIHPIASNKPSNEVTKTYK